MENKNEKSMTLEEMIGEMLKDAKVVKVPLPVRAEEKTEVQKQDKPMPARPSSVPVLSLNIENLHVHMDERMTSYNYGFGQEPDAEADDPVEDIDFDEMLERMCPTSRIWLVMSWWHLPSSLRWLNLAPMR